MSAKKTMTKKPAASKAEAKKAKDIARLKAWKSAAMKSDAYRAEQNARQRARMAKLRMDARIGALVGELVRALVEDELGRLGLAGRSWRASGRSGR